ncbi:MAG: sigma-70 family RNA polymerase sigma factor [Candidatus Altiarchaeales archaeon]|nr:sigma-70 family RNA polymerase sigma factor [Candidatus Altiarchaeales archaeon]
MSRSRDELAYLKEKLKGPIIRQIIDPKDFDVEDILKSYFREILFLAGRYSRPTVDYEDLVVEGIMGLLDAIERFDIDKAKGNPRAFHNLAVVRIKSYMFEYFLENSTQYSIPNYLARAMNLLEQVRKIVRSQQYTGDAERAINNYSDPEFEEAIPKEVKDKLAKVKKKLRKLANNCDRTYEEMVATVYKVEYDIDSHGSDNEEFEVSPEEVAGEREYLDKFLNNLNPSAREVITKLLEGKTLEQAGKEMGLTRERARQIKQDTINYFQDTKMYREATD